MDTEFALFQQIAAHCDEEKNVAARFYDKAVKTEKLTENGLPIFKNVTYVEIRIKDNSTEVYNQPATEEKIKRFPKEYALYKLSKEQVKKGTPLEQFSFLDAAEIATCKNRGIFTVESLAELDFEKVQNLSLQNEHVLAQMFMEQAEKNTDLKKNADKEQQYKDEIACLKEKIASLEKRLKTASKRKKETE
ncbi:MAG: hypothetical protein IJ564_04790 [Alphaproteobacteria bacterium]|nr:hypothetical protein [Alphaproteobacteria bacterium]